MEIFSEIKKRIPDFVIPANFISEYTDRADCYYMASCSQDQFILVDDSLEPVTGYPASALLGKGISWWFSITHPDDVDQMLSTIFQHCFLLSVHKRLNKPFSLEYRIRDTNGEWIWIHETKCVIEVTEEGKNDLILGRLVDITDIKKQDVSVLKKLMKEDGETNPLLRAAMPIISTHQQKPLNLTSNNMPTKREKEILQLIGEGYSTKEMAHKLHISVNTVETHRRHLLEKIQVKNSMELIKQTSKTHWLRAI